jgi:hypothetical protein
VGTGLVSKLGAQQFLLRTYANEERRDQESCEQHADAGTKGKGPAHRVDEHPKIAWMADHSIDPVGDEGMS